MWNGAISDAGSARSTTARSFRLVCLLLGVLVPSMPSMGHAQIMTGTVVPPVKTLWMTGLHSFAAGRTAFFTMSDIGAGSSLSSVRIEFRDDTDRLVAAIDGQLGRGQPVRLSKTIKTGSGIAQLRVIVTMDDLADRVPMAVFEDIGPDSLIARIIFCGPPGLRGGTQTYCPGFYITTTGGSVPSP